MAEPFGTLADGQAVERHRLKAGRLTAQVLTYGGILQDLVLETGRGPRRLVLGFERLEDYVAHSPYFGALVGRYANRIGGGRCRIEGDEVQLSLNEKDKTHLHGGFRGFDKKVWEVASADETSLDLRLESEAGEEGYPGRVETACRYELTDDDRLTITLGARTDATTLVNLTGHSYFNLNGEGDVLGHRLMIPAQRYTPVDADLIPTGELVPVAGSPFDFRSSREIGEGGYDHNWVLGTEPLDRPRRVACLEGDRSGIVLEVWSTEPGLQFYAGGVLDTPVPGLDGKPYGRNEGLCLEPQRFPDSPNHPGFTDACLKPGETYRHVIEYRLSGP